MAEVLLATESEVFERLSSFFGFLVGLLMRSYVAIPLRLR